MSRRDAAPGALALLWALTPSPMRRRLGAGLMFRLLQTAALAFAIVVAVEILAGLAGGERPSSALIASSGAAMTVSLALQFAFALLGTRAIWLASYRLVGALRRRLLSRLLRMPMRFHLATEKGALSHALTGDLQVLEMLLTDGLPRIVHAVAMPLLLMIALLRWDWAAGVAALAAITAALPVLFLSSRKLERLSAERQSRQAEAASRVLEFSEGMATIRSLGLSGAGGDHFRAPLQRLHDLSVQMVARLTAPFLGYAALVLAGMALVVAVAGWRYGAGLAGREALAAILLIVVPLFSPLVGLAQFMELAAVASGALERIRPVLTADLRPCAPALPQGHAIRFETVGFAYEDGRRVLDDVSFALPETGLVAVAGASGAGKSTLLHLVARFWDATQGRITIGGVDVRAIGPDRLDRLVSVVFQDVQLFEGTVFDNIAMGRDAGMADVERAARAASAHDFISALPQGYGTRVGEGGSALSGGERQRISLARAVFKNAPILLVDEGTAAVDLATEREIAAAIDRLASARCVIVAAHRAGAVTSAGCVLRLEDGRVRLERGGSG